MQLIRRLNCEIEVNHIVAAVGLAILLVGKHTREHLVDCSFEALCQRCDFEVTCHVAVDEVAGN